MAKYQTDQIRNVAILGHSGAGKTALAEALLFQNGTTKRLGRVDEGTTVSDWDAEEHRRKISINLAVTPLETHVDGAAMKVNLIDTPGYLDFVGELISALYVVEAGLVVVDAVAGAEVGTELAWEQLTTSAMPRVVFINRMDRENADFHRAVASLEEKLPGSTFVPMQLPIGTAQDFCGVVSVVTMKAYMGKEGTEAPIPDDMLDAVKMAHTALVEAAAESDEELMMKYFDDEELTVEEVRRGMFDGIRKGTFTPVYCGSAVTGLGVDRLIQSLVRYTPPPNAHPVPAQKNGEEIELVEDASGPVAAGVFRTFIDRYVGRMNYVRVFSGTIQRDTQLINQRTGRSYRIANLTIPFGKDLQNVDEVVAGDIGVITKLDDVVTTDTLTTAEQPLALAPPEYPRPLYTVAVAPATQADSAKLGTSLHSLAEEDPTLRVQVIDATKQTVLQGMGETHVDVAIRRLESKFGVHVETAIPKVPYRETITRTAASQYRHKKQSGGAGQFAEVHMRVEPLATGTGFEYASEVFGGAISGVFLPSIEKGVRSVLESGVIAGFPVVDVKAVVYDGKEHPVDSKDIAFQTAGREVFRLAFREAKPVLLEPIYNLDITVPEEFMGDVMGDLNTRRGRVQGMEQKGHRTVVHAQAPLAEILRYGTVLRSMTQGRGIYTMEFDHYDPVPEHLAKDVISQNKMEEAAE